MRRGVAVPGVPPRWFRLLVLAGALVVVAVASLAGCGTSTAPQVDRTGTDTTSSTVRYAALPPEARTTLRLVHSGGPFPYPRNDGVVFFNREGLLPAEPRGYYHEYTVMTPGASDRGARRIITGGGGEFYYTDDHYRSFQLIEGVPQ